MRLIQCAVMGSGGVGKSAVTVRFINGSFLEWYDPTIEDSYRKQFLVDAQPCLLEILDTAGLDQYLMLNDLFIRESDGFILVFSITQRDTFEDIIRAREGILRIKSPAAPGSEGEKDMPIVIVGNKADLAHDREVQFEEGEKLAMKWGAKYIETSAKHDTHIASVFHEIVRQMRREDMKLRGRDVIRRRRIKKCVVL